MSLTHLQTYLENEDVEPLFICGDARALLCQFPDGVFDCCLTSPPYWNQRAYHAGGLGEEDDYRQYIRRLLDILGEVQRVLKPTGSLWLNLGDTYHNKRLLGIPWRVALALMDE